MFSPSVENGGCDMQSLANVHIGSIPCRNFAMGVLSEILSGQGLPVG
jgi:hypothetical protein